MTMTLSKFGRPLQGANSSGELRYNCPKCGDTKYHLYLNEKKGKFHCFKCHFGGRLDVASLRHKREQIKVKMKYPRIPNFQTTMCLTMTQLKYLMGRGLSPERIKQMGIGTSSSIKLSGRVVIPIREGGAIVYFVARATCNDGAPVAKEIGPRNSDGFMKRSEVVYGLDELVHEQSVILVEGIFDSEHMRKLGFCSVALLGSNLSDVQLGKILSKRPTKIILMFDGDEAGRKGTLDAYRKISKRYRGKIVTVSLREGEDPDDLKLEDIKPLLVETRQ